MGGGLFKKRRQTRKQFEDPLTQPVVALTEPPALCHKKVKDDAAPDGLVSAQASQPRARSACLSHSFDQWRRAGQRLAYSSPGKGNDVWHRPGPIHARAR